LDERYNFALPLIKGMIEADHEKRIGLDMVKEQLLPIVRPPPV